MNASESDNPTGGENQSSSHVARMTAELLQAKARQRRRYIFATLALILSLFVMLAILVLSNATSIDVEPEEAGQIASVRVVDGVGKALGHKVYSWSANPTIEVSATGFRASHKTLSASEIGGTVRVELQPLPGELHIITAPESDQTRWFVDDRMVSVGAAFKQDLYAGNYSITIDSPYYLIKTLPITIKRAEQLQLSESLEKVSGQFHISTVPAGSEVHINDELIGKAPVSIAKQGGAYQIVVSYGDYEPITEAVELTNSASVVERDYRLLLKGAYLDVHTAPQGGQLLLDGKVVKAGRLQVKAGLVHSLRYEKDGYFPQHRKVSAKSGEEKSIAFNLKAEMGLVRVVSSPIAVVSIDGKEVGKTPLELELSAISHHLVIHKKGYRSHQQIVVPSSASVQRIKVVLPTEIEAKLAESPALMRNSAGIELKLFKPDDLFVMGAPRHEKGQRANEFLRTVRLTKPFYIATHEVSRSQFSRFKAVAGAKNEPVTSISWIEAAAYCNWLSQQEGMVPFYDIRAGRLIGSNIESAGYRLPSEAEWEWLSRKAGKSKQTRFAWGDDTTIAPKAGNIADESAKGSTARYVPNYSDGFAGVAPTGSFPVESMGLYDLTGNVSEWVHDVYALVPNAGVKAEVNPLGARIGDTHTVKGSNWRSGGITELRAAYREGKKAGRDDIGFRVARYVYGGINGEK